MAFDFLVSHEWYIFSLFRRKMTNKFSFAHFKVGCEILVIKLKCLGDTLMQEIYDIAYLQKIVYIYLIENHIRNIRI